MNLMDVMYKGYTVPEAPGRLVSFGMNFGNASYEPKKPKAKMKYGSIMGVVKDALLTTDWMACREIAEIVGLSAPSVRNALMGLTEKHEVQSKMTSKGTRVYRKI